MPFSTDTVTTHLLSRTWNIFVIFNKLNYLLATYCDYLDSVLETKQGVYIVREVPDMPRLPGPMPQRSSNN